MGDYHIPVKYLFNHITDLEIIDAPKITNKTIAIPIFKNIISPYLLIFVYFCCFLHCGVDT